MTFIPQRFADEVAAHLVMNMVSLPGVRPPLILAIHGPKGEGKTWQCDEIFKEMRVSAYWLSGEMFGSESEGMPVELIRSKYRDAAHHNRRIEAAYANSQWPSEELAVLFINDVDQRLGRADDLIQQTINTQLINATLMELADEPTRIGDATVPRVPIVMTANNLSILYGPLCREGRMHRFEWRPTDDEKVEVARHVIPEPAFEERRLRQLLREVERPPPTADGARSEITLATLAAVNYELHRECAVRYVRKVGLTEALASLRASTIDPTVLVPTPDADDVDAAIRAVLERQAAVDHLS